MNPTSRLRTRQRLRRLLLLLSFVLLPVTLYYFSPVLVLGAASEGVVNGSLLVFALMLAGALFLGRLWCGWGCPAGGLQDCATLVNDRAVPGGRCNWIKWGIWIPWVALIAVLAIRAGGLHSVDPFYGLEGGVTLDIPEDPSAPPWYLIYFIVVGLFLGLALLIGRRAGCHYVCWMAPFMIIGRKVSNLVRGPALRLTARPDLCTNCLTCNRHCPMSLDVNVMVRSGRMDDSECILCLSCVDGCPSQAISLRYDRLGPGVHSRRTEGAGAAQDFPCRPVHTTE